MAKILIAEDEPDIRNLITFTLRFAGHEVGADFVFIRKRPVSAQK